MRKATYFAVFEPSDNGWGVYFPGLDGCVSFGTDFSEATQMAQEALELHLWGLEEEGLTNPEPLQPPFANLPENAIVSAVTVYPDLVRQDMENRSVRTNVSIPAWLKNAAESAGLNYSQVLQAALSELLNVKHASGR